EGKIHYRNAATILEQISLSLMPRDRIAIMGDNGSGKSTLIKAILDDPNVMKSGLWLSPKRNDFGYLDQHYATLDTKKSVLESLQECVPKWQFSDYRFHLADFLFRSNEEVTAKVASLSGGEKVRLTLALVAAKTPRLLILDEITNNLDLETREHVIQVLREYPGCLITISHDEDFLTSIGVTDRYRIASGLLLSQ
ncbi:MAG: ATP-binding cassette domain-containing protein, partial [Pseudomonadota bacterium]|nr:ATP-binding cassette domain-containing protein [Pseudomonadota bacterium]